MRTLNVKKNILILYLIFLLITINFVGLSFVKNDINYGEVKAASTWTQDSNNDFNSGTLNNVTVFSPGEIRLGINNSYIIDNFANSSMVNYTKGVIIDTVKKEARLTLQHSINKSYDNNDRSDHGHSIQETLDGGYVFCGVTDKTPGYDKAWVIKTDSMGNEIWNKTYFAGQGTWASHILQTTDGGYIFVGSAKTYHITGPVYDLWLVKINDTGVLQWQKLYGKQQYQDYGYHIENTSDGGYIISGKTASFGTGGEYIWLLKVNSTGDFEWNRTYAKCGDYTNTHVQITSDGGYILVGTKKSSTYDYDYYIVKTNETGSIQWSRIFGGNDYDHGYGVLQTQDGGYIVVGGSESYGPSSSSNYQSVWVLKLNETGSLKWSRTFGGTSLDKGWDIDQTQNGSYIITGISSSFNPGFDYDLYLLKINNTGNKEWEMVFGDTGDDFGREVKVANDGQYLIVGWNGWTSQGGEDIWFMKTTGYDNITQIGLLESKTLLKNKKPMNVEKFKCTTYIPSGSNIYVQFSKNKTTWYNSKGKIDQWDTLANGGNILDLSFLKFNGSNLYYRANFTTTDIRTIIPILKEINMSGYTYKNEGSYVSIPYDAGIETSWISLHYNYTKLPGTNNKLQIKTAKTKSGLNSKTFVGPDGTNKTYYIVNQSPIWQGHDGDKWIQYKVDMSTIDTTLTPILNQVTINYNCWPDKPTLIAPDNNTYTNNNKPTFSWKFNDRDTNEQCKFIWQLDDSILFDSIYFDSGEVTSNSSIYNYKYNLPDNKWYWRVKTQDIEGNWGEFSDPNVLIIDTEIGIPSNISIEPATWTKLNCYEVSWENPKDLSEITGGFYKLDSKPLSIEDGIFKQGNNITSIQNIKVDSEGEHTIYIWLKDRVGNINHNNYSTAKLYYDKTSPPKPDNLIVTPKDWTNNNLFTVDWDNPGDPSGIKNGAYYFIDIYPPKDLSNGTWISEKPFAIDEKAYEGEYNIYVWLEDNPGNTNFLNYAVSVLRFDKTQPTELSIVINEGEQYTNNNLVNLDLRAFDTYSSLEEMSFSFDSAIWTAWESYKSKKIIKLPLGEGEKTIFFKVKDKAGNIAETFDTIILDSTLPEELSISVNNDDELTNTKEVELELNAIDILSGINKMSFSFNNTDWTKWESYKTKKNIILPVGDGQKIVYFRVIDKAGNIKQTSDTIILDTKAPQSLMISINKGANETDSVEVNLELYAYDETSEVHQMSFSSNGRDWSDWIEFTYILSYKLSAGDGYKIIYFRVNDKAGNIAAPIRTMIQLNTIKTMVDIDTDNDNYPDEIDAYPNDPTRWEKGDTSDGKTKKDNTAIIGMVILIVVLTIIFILLLFMFFKKEKPLNKDNK